MSDTITGALPAAADSGKSLTRSVAESGRLTGAAHGLVIVVLLCLFAMNQWILVPKVDQALLATTVTRISHEAMLDQQDGLRGFLASGDEQFLEAYQRGHKALPNLIAEANELIGGRSVLGAEYLALRSAQQAWLDEWAVPALAKGRAGTRVSASFIRRDKTLFDEYRARYDILITKLLESRNDAVQEQRQALMAAIALALIVTAAAGVLGHRRNRALRRDVGAPLGALLKRLEQIREGDLTPRPIPKGPREFEILAAGLEEAAGTLSQGRSTAERQANALAARGQRQAEVLAFARTVSGNLNLRDVLNSVCTHASAIADGARAVVWVMDADRTLLEPFGDSEGPDSQPIGLTPTPVGEGVVGNAGRLGTVQGRSEATYDSFDRIAVPMVVGAQVTGVLELVGARSVSSATKRSTRWRR